MAWQIEQAKPLPQLAVPNVCILMPHQASVSLEFVETTYGPLKFVPRNDFAKTFRVSRGIPLDVTRNELVKMALEDKTVTHTLFLDSDMLAESDVNEAIKTLLSLNVPIASALYRAKKQKGDYCYAMWAKHPTAGYGYISFDKWTGNWITADAVGMGFCLIKREVWERIPQPWFEWKTPSPSEDFWFCEKARSYGYEIKVFTDIRFSHASDAMKVKSDGSVHTLDV